MKKFYPVLVLLLATFICLMVAACAKNEDGDTTADSQSSEVATSDSDTEDTVNGGSETPNIPNKRPGVDNNPVDPPSGDNTGNVEETVPVQPPKSPGGNELPPIWIEN